MTKPAKTSMKMRFDNLGRKSDTVSAKGGEQRNELFVQPPRIVETVVSSGLSQASSIGIGEFGMNVAKKGNAVAFSIAVKEKLFRQIKFLQGTSASLEFNMDTTSICGYMRSCCGVTEENAYQWWEDHRATLKSIHTDCRNNKIKMIKQQFIGKFTHCLLGCIT